jgi:hypothetical protein
LVRGRKQGVRAHVGGLAKLTKEALQPGEFVTAGALVRIPHHDREVVPPQRIADRLTRRVDVDFRLPGHDLSDSQCADAVLVLQPSFALVLVDGDDLLRDPVDVLEERGGYRFQRGEAGGGRDIGLAQGLEHEVVQLALAQPIGPDQGVDRHAVLGQPAGILQRRSRRLDSFHRDVVTQRVQQGVDISLDAGAQQFDGAGIAAQFGDRLLKGTTDGRRQLHEAVVHLHGGLGHEAADVHFVHHIRLRHPLTVDLPVATGGRFDSAELSPEDNIGRHLDSSATVSKPRGISTVLASQTATFTEEHPL